MQIITFDGRNYSAREGETVLDCLLRHGVELKFSCRNGICRTCLLKSLDPVAIAEASHRLPAELAGKGYFLPCRTTARNGMHLAAPEPEDIRHAGGATKSAPPVAESSLDREEAPYPPPDQSLWVALEEGHLLKRIVDDFYDLVFEDTILSPYFHNTTKQRSKEKVFSFYKRLFSGEECYFGDRPRNAHHWMVISDDIFDYRLRLLTSVMERHGLEQRFILIWQGYEEHYRQDIVKSEPRGRRIGDITLPAGGFDFEVLDEGTLCDSCEEPVEKGVQVLYNKRTGEIYCPACHRGDAPMPAAAGLSAAGKGNGEATSP